ncbi:uncharacterized protein TRUGW13939_10413 [Talaromyces rugulosus]|uniref:Uncharacterized protein n=1 Tax=Talaromyces rugulosus TaxID=121627 RepID=A0A7H8R9Z5_TALRU|nr:uncharacterized protein TRUGW13939_10413 [Talaromyces rugulosus]QKX63244.1 hypothetical protein TRUGW13939_10413 [Talaromyces rugulosus]
MYNFKLLAFAALLCTSEVLAGKLQISTWNTKGGLKGEGGLEKLAAGNIPNEYDHLVLQHIHAWSGGTHTASQGGRSGNVYVVSTKHGDHYTSYEDSKTKATEANRALKTKIHKEVKKAEEEAARHHHGHGGGGSPHGSHGSHGGHGGHGGHGHHRRRGGVDEDVDEDVEDLLEEEEATE